MGKNRAHINPKPNQSSKINSIDQQCLTGQISATISINRNKHSNIIELCCTFFVAQVDVHCFLLTDLLLICKPIAKKGMGNLKVTQHELIDICMQFIDIANYECVNWFTNMCGEFVFILWQSNGRDCERVNNSQTRSINRHYGQ